MSGYSEKKIERKKDKKKKREDNTSGSIVKCKAKVLGGACEKTKGETIKGRNIKPLNKSTTV